MTEAHKAVEMTEAHKAQLTKHAETLEEAARMIVVLSMGTRPYEHDVESLQVVDEYLDTKTNFKRLLSLLIQHGEEDSKKDSKTSKAKLQAIATGYNA